MKKLPLMLIIALTLASSAQAACDAQGNPTETMSTICSTYNNTPESECLRDIWDYFTEGGLNVAPLLGSHTNADNAAKVSISTQTACAYAHGGAAGGSGN